MPIPQIGEPEPPKDCNLCPRLKAFREANNAVNPSWFNGAVPSFGPQSAELLIVGLAPGLKGANRTGRPFTGDYAGDLLYPTLKKFGFGKGTYQSEANDDFALQNCMITNAVRCVPPQNKPIGSEINNCRAFFSARLTTLPNLKVIISLGRIAHDQVIRTIGAKLADYKFEHNKAHSLPSGQTMVNSYHCSRYNTNTGRLTTEMFEDVFSNVTGILKA